MCYGMNLTGMSMFGMNPLMSSYGSGYGCGCGGTSFGSMIGNYLAYGACDMAMQFGGMFGNVLMGGLQQAIFSSVTQTRGGVTGTVDGGATQHSALETVQNDIDNYTQNANGLIKLENSKYSYDGQSVEASLEQAYTTADIAYEDALQKVNTLHESKAKLVSLEITEGEAKAARDAAREALEKAPANERGAKEKLLAEAIKKYDEAEANRKTMENEIKEIEAIDLTKLEKAKNDAEAAIKARQAELTEITKNLNEKMKEKARLDKASHTGALDKADRTIGERAKFSSVFDYKHNEKTGLLEAVGLKDGEKWSKRKVFSIINEYRTCNDPEKQKLIAKFLKTNKETIDGLSGINELSADTRKAVQMIIDDENMLAWLNGGSEVPKP